MASSASTDRPNSPTFSDGWVPDLFPDEEDENDFFPFPGFLNAMRDLAGGNVPPTPAVAESADQPAVFDVARGRQLLQQTQECPICLEGIREATLTACMHVFCRACIVRWIESASTCPLDRRKLSHKDLTAIDD